jgi:EAL domain-containing protein (putative c-di-GMP-specific phosphodiesterase class I)
LEYVNGEFEKTGIPGSKICFEITETAAIANFASAGRLITDLKKRGCQFALDDFGSGLCSFAYLRTLPVDFLKIDGVFVKGVVDDPVDLAMVKSINDLGHVLGKRTVAEFVETQAILGKVSEIGVDYAQGYGISRPRPLDELTGVHAGL